MPPPNVTGVLHMGHALNGTLQDVLARYWRMRGKKVLWQAGMDHAGIATQMVVERQMAESGTGVTRSDMGRDAFVERVWQWKEESGGRIFNQFRRLGASCDWSRQKFTMGDSGADDDQMMAAVRKVFIDLYDQGLIYRDKRLVNWDPHFRTAISDLEVNNREVDGHFWHFRYPLENGETYTHIERDADGNVTLEEERDYISIATTRPETMLGDGAVAVHPSDERYASIIGKKVSLPLVDRLIPIIADSYPDPELGSGAVKITGAHDFNDYQVARRHELPLFILMDEAGKMATANHVPEKYRGMDRFDARIAVVEDIDALGLLLRVEDRKIQQPFGDRSNVVIEPMLTDQWYVDAKTLAQPALEAVRDGRTRFVPQNWEKTYFDWLERIEPWCVSRQLWWGHRIPAWFAPDGTIFVAENEDTAKAEARKHFGKDVNLTQDEDVLDTWFSSALWPFSTLGWPDQTTALKTFYPTSVLVTAFDIIFFWVARMMMQGIHFMDEVPFKDIYIHALVLDEQGQKMSKSKGNAIDPLELIDAFGADALRFNMAAMAAQGRNVRLSKQRVEGYRNFGTKLWNAARFCQMNECVLWSKEAFRPTETSNVVNRWILAELSKATIAVSHGIEDYRFNDAAAAIYRFVWNTFCDWYLELIKPSLNGSDEALKAETRQTAAFVLDEVLKLLHPFMPFITEEIWDKVSEHGPDRETFLMLTGFPDPIDFEADADAEEIEWVISLITDLRSARSDLHVPAGAKVPMTFLEDDPRLRERVLRHAGVISRMTRLESLKVDNAPPQGSVTSVAAGAAIGLRIADLIDVEDAAKRIGKELNGLEKDAAATERKLSNEKFLERAPPEVVEENRDRLNQAQIRIEKLEQAKSALSTLA